MYLISKNGKFRFDEHAIRNTIEDSRTVEDPKEDKIRLKITTYFYFHDGTSRDYPGPLADFHLAKHFIENETEIEEPDNA